MKMTKDEFRQTDDCQFCGSQRCDASDEMMDFCHKFLEANWQGLCAHCARALMCPDSRRWLDMQECNQYIDSKVLKCGS